jgi:hypothetical protein
VSPLITMKHDIELLADEISRLKMESKQRQDQLLTQEYEYSKKQKLNLTPDPTHERHRVPTHQSHITTTEEIDKSTIDRNTEFQQLIESNNAKHEQDMASGEGLIADLNTDYIKQISQLEDVNKQNSALIAQISPRPAVIIVSKNQPRKFFKRHKKGD